MDYNTHEQDYNDLEPFFEIIEAVRKHYDEIATLIKKMEQHSKRMKNAAGCFSDTQMWLSMG
jgi:hypothetical protein